jgi:Fe2+ transport system protein FeoA
LRDCESGTPFRIVRVINQEQEFLRYLASYGVGIGVEAVVDSRHPEVGTITIRLKGKSLVLSQVAAASLLVETL